MQLKVGAKYRTRNGLTAKVQKEIDFNNDPYRFWGEVYNEDGSIYRKITSWLHNGAYSRDRQTTLDIIEEIPNA